MSFYYTWENIRKSYINNEFKISDLTWKKEFELPDGYIFINKLSQKNTHLENMCHIVFEKTKGCGRTINRAIVYAEAAARRFL